MPQIIIVIILFIIIEILSYFYQKLFIGFKFLRGFLFSGIFIHEFSHYLACKLTLAPVQQFKIGWQAGHVTHGKSKIPIVGGMLISLAPLIVGIFLLVILFLWITGASFNDFWQLFQGGQFKDPAYLTVYFNNAWVNIKVISWQFWVWLFLNLNILAVFVPSKQDFKNIIFGLILYILISYFWLPMIAVNTLVIFALSFALVMLILALIVLLVLTLLKKVFV